MSILDVFKQKNKIKPGDILKTTDGFFANDSTNKKTRPIVVFDKRKDDGALAVSKIHSKDGKDIKNIIDNFNLQPQNHSALTKTSVIEKRVIFGVKTKDENNKTTFKPIYGSDLTKTSDKLTRSERHRYKANAGGSTKQNKQTLKSTTKKWKKHFK